MSEDLSVVAIAETSLGPAQCRSCLSGSGKVVLDLGNQPASDHFPSTAEQGADPLHPLQMWLCSSCGLAQLLVDPTVPEEPLATEPAALVEQAAAAVDKLIAAGWLRPGQRAFEYGSPHGGSWLTGLVERGLMAAGGDEQADVVLDCFGLMHEMDQRSAIAERAFQVAPGGALLLQFHSIATIIRLGQWNSLRHGHYAYYSVTALSRMLAHTGFQAVSAWTFDLYGGTVLIAAQRTTDAPTSGPHAPITAVLEAETALRVTAPEAFEELEETARRDARALTRWLDDQRVHGRLAVAYGAASRAVSLLCMAGVSRDLLPGVADASAAKHGRRMPGTDIPVISPAEMAAMSPDVVLLLLPDLLDEVRATLPEIESSGGRWETVEDLRGKW